MNPGKLTKITSKVAQNVAKGTGEAIEGGAKAAKWAAKEAAKGTSEFLWGGSKVAVKAGNIIKEGIVYGIDTSTDVIIPNKKFMKNEIEAVKKTGKRYNQCVERINKKALQLYKLRDRSGRKLVYSVESYINSLANSPKKLNNAVAVFSKDYREFDRVISEISKASIRANESFAKSSTGGALAGVGVAAFAPSAAMALATTFGTASTGAAISSLSGAAATNAALAWLGGGALAAGGGGMTAGNALLAMAGPIGWTIGGIALISGGIMMNRKCLESVDEAITARKSIEHHIAKLTTTNTKINNLIKLTKEHIKEIKILLNNLKESAPSDFRQFTVNQKKQIGSLVNHITALSGLLNQTID